MNRVFVEAARFVIENCETLSQLEKVGEHLKADRIATNEEKRLLRDDFARVRKWLMGGERRGYVIES